MEDEAGAERKGFLLGHPFQAEAMGGKVGWKKDL